MSDSTDLYKYVMLVEKLCI